MSYPFGVTGSVLGYQQVTGLTVPVSLAVPAGTQYATVAVSGAGVRFRADGIAPTASVGFPIANGKSFVFQGQPNNLLFIQQAATATLDVVYYGATGATGYRAPSWILSSEFGQAAGLDLDFQNNRYYQAGRSGALVSTSRASVGYADDVAGNWTNFANNVPRITNKGLLVEEARTNSIRNNSMQGVVAGSPGTLPTNWAIVTPTGLTRTISLGATAGVEWIEINLTGTTTNTTFISINFESTTGIAATNGQTWSDSFWLSNPLSTGLTSLTAQHQQYDGGGVFLANILINNLLKDISWQRISATITNNNASTAFIRTSIVSNTITSGTALNVTFRIGWPQLELGASATSPIRTTSAAVTRAADVVTVTSPPVFGSSLSVFGKGTPLAPTTYASNQALIEVSSGADANRVNLARVAASAFFNGFIAANSSTLLNSGGSGGTAWTQNLSAKGAVGQSIGSQAAISSLSAGVGTAASSTAFSAPISVINIGSRRTSTLQFNGFVERIAVWPNARLSNDDLQRLTAP